MKFIIYALQDPVTNVIRYVGRSSSGLTRPRRHFSVEHERAKRDGCHAWVRDLLARGLEPKIVVLESFDQIKNSDLNELERKWIARYRAQPDGHLLTNATCGGQGRLGYKLSVETRRKLSEARKGIRFTAEHKHRLSLAKKGKPQSYKATVQHRNKISVALAGRPKTDGHRKKLSAALNRMKRRVVREDGVVYESVREAARELASQPTNIRTAIRNGWLVRGHRLYLATSLTTYTTKAIAAMTNTSQPKADAAASSRSAGVLASVFGVAASTVFAPAKQNSPSPTSNSSANPSGGNTTHRIMMPIAAGMPVEFT